VTLLVATTNPGKIREIRGVLAGLTVRLETLEAHPGIPEADETGTTFAENARDKARHYSRLTGRLAVAEDSGLVIDALDGAPGVLSARFNGGSYPERFAAIYRILRERSVDGSPARFVCALAVADGDAIVFEATGTVEGRIAPHPAGEEGFGYDPIFFYPPFGCTLAEVSRDRKASVSHRGQAFRQLRGLLERR